MEPHSKPGNNSKWAVNEKKTWDLHTGTVKKCVSGKKMRDGYIFPFPNGLNPAVEELLEVLLACDPSRRGTAKGALQRVDDMLAASWRKSQGHEDRV